MSMVATAAVPLDVLGGEIVACIQRIFRDQKKADEWRATAREKLHLAFQGTGNGAAFEAFLLPLCEKIKVIQDDSGVPMPLSLSYAYEIMAKTPEESRADWRDQAARKRVVAKALKDAAKAPKTPDVPADTGTNSRSPGKSKSLPAKAKSQQQWLTTIRNAWDKLNPETRREALAYFLTEIKQ
jgi:hypothetical protein